MSFFDQAAPLARLGWLIHPVHGFVNGVCTCGRGDHGTDSAKHPRLAGWQDDATTDLGQLARWDGRWPDANVGIVTGPRSGLLVLDVDGEVGRSSLAELERVHGPLPVTPRVRTGSGGQHYLFRWTTECEGLTTLAGFLPGLDYRGKGGQVVAPPSLHRSGRRYEWEVGLDVPLAEPPPWLIGAMRDGHRTNPAQPSRPATDDGPVGVIVVEADDDLFGPGVEEGRRYQELLRRVGHHLARGDSPETILPLALGWSERCTPPYPVEDAERQTLALIAKEERKSSERANGVGGANSSFARSNRPDAPPSDGPGTSLARSTEAEWPSLGDDALHGLAGEVIRTIAPQTEADPVSLLITTLVAFGNCVGRRPYFPVEGDQHHGNMFAVLVGQSAKGRKGTSKGRVLSLFDPADPWRENCVVNGLSSGEGVIYAVRDPVIGNEPVRDKGKVIGYEPVVRDHGVEDKRLMVFEPEFAKVLKAKGREGNTLSEVIREAWDTGNLRVLTRTSPIRSTDAHVSLLGHVTLDELVECIRTTDAYNGLANRFLWPLVRRSQRLPEGGNDLDLAPLRQRLSQAVARARTIGRVTRTEEATALWKEAYLGELATEHAGLVGACTARSDAQVLRLSLLYALLDGAGQIGPEHLRAALAVWRYCEASAKLVFRQSEVRHGVQPTAPPPDCKESLALRLLNTIRAHAGVNRRGLYSATGNRVKAEEMDAALNWLRESGLAEPREGHGNGRPGECWWPRASEPTATVRAESLLAVEQTPQTPPGLIVPGEDASVRTKVESEESAVIVRSLDMPAADPMHVRFEEVNEPGLVGLADALTWMAQNGRQLTVVEGAVGCAPGPVPDWLAAVLAANQERLRPLVQSPPGMASPGAADPQAEMPATGTASQGGDDDLADEAFIKDVTDKMLGRDQPPPPDENRS